jgi:hypothetical protein
VFKNTDLHIVQKQGLQQQRGRGHVSLGQGMMLVCGRGGGVKSRGGKWDAGQQLHSLLLHDTSCALPVLQAQLQ